MTVAAIAGLLDLQGWRDRAACRAAPTELFFSDDESMQATALDFCDGCDVVEDCLQFALDHIERIGVWGATTPEQRARLLRGQRRRPVRRAACGTESGATRHRRMGEPICDACREARNAAAAERKAS